MLMRRLRTRARFESILLALLVITLVFFLDEYISKVAPDVRVLAENELERFLGYQADVTVGSVHGGIFRDYLLEDILIVDKTGTIPPVTIDSISLRGGLAEIVFRLVRDSGDVLYALEPPTLDITIRATKGLLNGLLEVTGDGKEFAFHGVANPFKKDNISFQGMYQPMAGAGMHTVDVAAYLARGAVMTNAIFDQGTLSMDTTVSDVDILGTLVSGDFHVTGKRSPERDSIEAAFQGFGTAERSFLGVAIVVSGYTEGAVSVDRGRSLVSVEGHVESKEMLINQRPFRNVSFDYALFMPFEGSGQRSMSSVLEIRKLAIGKEIKAWGSIVTDREGYPMDMVITIDNLNITRLLLDFQVQMPQLSMLSGIVNGQFSMKGPLGTLVSQGRLDVRKGNLGEIFFESMSVALRGEGPIIRITDSRINMKEGYMMMLGEMDLRDISKGTLMEDVQFCIDNRCIEWGGWRVVKHNTGDMKIQATKPVSDTVNVGFTTFITDEDIEPRIQEDRQSALEVEYQIYQKDSLKMRMGADREYVGLEHREQF